MPDAHPSILVHTNAARFQEYAPKDDPFVGHAHPVFVPAGATAEEIAELGASCEMCVVDAITPMPKELIRALPKLKLIHSEGVGFNAIDCAAAAEQGIYVCNCKGANAPSVAEQAILLMLGVLRKVVPYDRAVREGRQFETKTKAFAEGCAELGECHIGLVGLGDCGSAVAERLQGFGCSVSYWSAHRRPEDIERKLHVSYLPLDRLLATSDIVSLHVAVTPETKGMADASFLDAMPEGSILINTARGELVDNDALIAALTSDHLAGAGLDTVAPEPVLPYNPLLLLPPDIASRILFSPHVGGSSKSSFRRAHRMIWSNIEAVFEGRRPINIVNGL